MTSSADLIISFRQAHHAITFGISDIQQVLRSYSQARPKLRELNEQLLAHWARQHDSFWQRLAACHADDREKTKMLGFLQHDLKDIKVQHLLFFDKHSGEWGDVNARNFPKDFMDFAETVLARIQMEEEYLLPMLKNLPS